MKHYEKASSINFCETKLKLRIVELCDYDGNLKSFCVCDNLGELLKMMGIACGDYQYFLQATIPFS